MGEGTIGVGVEGEDTYLFHQMIKTIIFSPMKTVGSIKPTGTCTIKTIQWKKLKCSFRILMTIM